MSEFPSAAYPLGLLRIPGVGTRTVARVVRSYGDPDSLRAASPAALEDTIGKRAAHAVGPYLVAGLDAELATARDLVRLHEDSGIAVVGLTDPAYPPALRLTDDPPAALFVKGRLDCLGMIGVAVVGTREPTPIGVEMARRIAMRFATAGFCVVSGLALGIDAAAHEGALRSGTTLAVLGTPPDEIYPREHVELARRIEASGALVSEYPIGTRVGREAFVQRDRIQAGIATAIVPVQTGVQGGTMHTIAAAERAQRLLLCPVPDQRDSDSRQSQGIRLLIESGRGIAFDGSDYERLIEMIGEAAARTARPAAPSGEREQQLLLSDAEATARPRPSH